MAGGGVAINQETLSGEPEKNYSGGGSAVAQNMGSGAGGFMPSQSSFGGNGFMSNQNASEPVVRYGTGGRISGFAEGGDVRNLAKYGRNGDTILAHINPQEARLLKSLGGSGTINPVTGLPEFMFADEDFDSISLEGGGGGMGGWSGGWGGGWGGFGQDDMGIIGGDSDFDWGDMDSGPGAYDISNPDIPEIEIVDTRPPSEPINDIPEIEIVDTRPPVEPPIYNPPIIEAPPIDIALPPVEDDVPELVITDTKPPVESDPLDAFLNLNNNFVTPDEDDVPELVITDTKPVVEPPDEPPEPPVVEPPYVPPYVPPVVPPVVPPPVEPPVQPPVQPPVTPTNNIYRSQYQNYADPLTMFNVSNYGRDPATSAGFNYATAPGGMGIDTLNQNLRDYADEQMARTYDNGALRGADMNEVLAAMRSSGLTATDLENARYGRTTGLNTPFSQYNTQAPTAAMFGAPASAPAAPAGPGMAGGGIAGIAALIGNLPS